MKVRCKFSLFELRSEIDVDTEEMKTEEDIDDICVILLKDKGYDDIEDWFQGRSCKAICIQEGAIFLAKEVMQCRIHNQ